MKNNKTLSKLNSYIAGNRKYLILVIISALLANIFMLVAPYFRVELSTLSKAKIT